MKKLLLLIIASLILSPAGFAQFFDLTQPNQAPTRYNPGFTGSLKDARATAIVRNNVLGERSSGKNAYLSYDQLSNKLKGGIGADFSYSKFGDNYQMEFGANYAPKIHLGGQWTFSPGLRLQGQFSKVQVITNFPNVPIETEPKIENYLAVMPGVVFNTSNFYVGASLSNLFHARLSKPHPVYTDLTTPNRVFIFQTGYNRSVSATSSIAISATVRRFPGVTVAQPQVVLRWNSILFGTGFTLAHTGKNRTPVGQGSFFSAQTPFLSMGYKHDRFRINASLTLPQTKTDNASALEIGATLYLPRKMKDETVANF